MVSRKRASEPSRNVVSAPSTRGQAPGRLGRELAHLARWRDKFLKPAVRPLRILKPQRLGRILTDGAAFKQHRPRRLDLDRAGAHDSAASIVQHPLPRQLIQRNRRRNRRNCLRSCKRPIGSDHSAPAKGRAQSQGQARRRTFSQPLSFSASPHAGDRSDPRSPSKFAWRRRTGRPIGARCWRRALENSYASARLPARPAAASASQAT